MNTIIHCSAITQMQKTAVCLLQNTAVLENTQKKKKIRLRSFKLRKQEYKNDMPNVLTDKLAHRVNILKPKTVC